MSIIIGVLDVTCIKTKKKRPSHDDRSFLVAGVGFEPTTLWL